MVPWAGVNGKADGRLYRLRAGGGADRGGLSAGARDGDRIAQKTIAQAAQKVIPIVPLNGTLPARLGEVGDKVL